MDVYRQFVKKCKWMGETPIKPQTSDTKWQLAFGKGGLWRDAQTGKQESTYLGRVL